MELVQQCLIELEQKETSFWNEKSFFMGLDRKLLYLYKRFENLKRHNSFKNSLSVLLTL
jgi:hypothetical protein